MSTKWISVSEYAKKLGKSSPQVIYNWIATGKLKEGKDWRWKEITIRKKEVLYKNKKDLHGETA